MLGKVKKCSQDLLIFQIFRRALVLLVGRLFFRPRSLRKPTRWGLAKAVIQGLTEHAHCKNNTHQPFIAKVSKLCHF